MGVLGEGATGPNMGLTLVAGIAKLIILTTTLYLDEKIDIYYVEYLK